MRETRDIVQIDEELCDGCGLCIPSCAEGAIEIVNGKARLKAERYCDGLGACLGNCPKGALKVIQREADPFDEEAVHAMLKEEAQAAERTAPAKPLGCGCPGSNVISFAKPRPKTARAGVTSPCACMSAAAPEDEAPANRADEASAPRQESELTHWPVQIRLVPPSAPFLKGADLLIAADCAPVACANFHGDFLKGRAVMIGCPKFDEGADYVTRLTEVFRQARPRSVTILRMEVPCCAGLSRMVREAAARAGTGVPVADVVVTRQGETRPAEESAPLSRLSPETVL